MKTIKIQNVNNITFSISAKSELEQQDTEFIKNYSSKVYSNDSTGNLWTFDTKLPSGKWLENIEFNNELTKAKALVL